MKLDQNASSDGRGKYALVNLRKLDGLAPEARESTVLLLDVLERRGLLEIGRRRRGARETNAAADRAAEETGLPLASMKSDAASVLASIDAGRLDPHRCLADCACHTLALAEAVERLTADLGRLRRAACELAFVAQDMLADEQKQSDQCLESFFAAYYREYAQDFPYKTEHRGMAERKLRPKYDAVKGVWDLIPDSFDDGKDAVKKAESDT